jgi:hypothetical protein
MIGSDLQSATAENALPLAEKQFIISLDNVHVEKILLQ